MHGGFFKSTIEHKRSDCSFDDFLDVSLLSLQHVDLPFGKNTGQILQVFCPKQWTKHSCHSKAFPTKLRQENNSHSQSRGKPRHLTWPWGLLCASQTRSDAAKEQKRWKRQLQRLFQSSPSKVGLEQSDTGSTGEGSRESRHNWLDEQKAESRWWCSQNQKLKPQLIKETKGEQMQTWLCWWTWKQLQEFWLCQQHNFISWLCAWSHQ